MAHYDPAFLELTSLLDSPEINNGNPAVKERLEKIKDLFNQRHSYADSFTTQQSAALAKIRADTLSHPWQEVYNAGKISWNMPAYMISGPVTAKCLQFFISMVQAKRVLEIGMFTGYTALAMAEALPADGVVHTCDIEAYLVELNKTAFGQSPHGKKIKMHLGPANETIQKLGEEGLKFDVVFIDADKPGYRGYVEAILEKDMLAARGIILADNAFYLGKAYTGAKTREANPMNDFNEHILSNPDLEQVLLPVRDGILAIRRKSDVDGQV